MCRPLRFAENIAFSLLLATSLAAADESVSGRHPEISGPVEMSFIKGDTRNGSKVHIRIVGDSLYYSQVTFHPNADPLESRKTMMINAHRRKALKGVIGELPRYPVFGTCYGKDMRFYMVETAGGKFYRSLPERSGKCYSDEPGIWSLFQDLDDLMAPPSDPDFRDYSAS